MITKVLEVRDRATFLPVLCVDMSRPDGEGARYLMRRLGFPCDGSINVMMTPLRLSGEPAWNDYYAWESYGSRTLRVAHEYIYEHWDELRDGDVVDVEFILGETAQPKTSERFGLDDDEGHPERF